jgi:hypothetical protein
MSKDKMKIINTHQRKYEHPIDKISKIFESLSSTKDMMWPHERWSPMTLEQGLNVGSSGGHGPIKYFVSQYNPGRNVEFTFIEPSGFRGIHKFELNETINNSCLLKHQIKMNVSFKGFILWYFAIKWLHDALIEDCFDKVQNQISTTKSHTKWNAWVKILRALFKKDK